MAEAFRLSASSKFQAAPIPLSQKRESAHRLRVGLGVTAGGRPLRSSGVMFMVGGPFKMYRKKSGEVISRGAPRELFL